MKIPKIKTKKIKDFLRELPKKLSQRAFLTFFLFFLIFLILGYFIFYQYSILEKEPKILEKPIEFKEKNYQRVLEFWKEREERLKFIETKEYLDPFKGLTEK
jgi:uncharacterized protein YneF (UPF0154 family)